MRSNESLHLAPPWGTKRTWQEANRSIDDLVQRYCGKLASAVALAASLRDRLASIFSLLDDLCLETCPQCPDPCCLHASPWFDFRDLVFFHLDTLPIPFRQTIESLSATCRYAGPRGCTLARISRPWICTWYLCSVQTANLNSRRAHQRKDLTLAINEIKALRKELEERFVREIVQSPSAEDP
jgi:hypothetical protein